VTGSLCGGDWRSNAQGHRVFLNETARKILAGVPKPKKPKKAVWVFPKSRMGDYKHVGRRLAQRTRANIVVAPKTHGKGRDRVDIRGHDLRRTAASLMASGGVPRFVISRILNHSEEKDITSVYDRYSYDAEKRGDGVLESAAGGRSEGQVRIERSTVCLRSRRSELSEAGSLCAMLCSYAGINNAVAHRRCSCDSRRRGNRADATPATG